MEESVIIDIKLNADDVAKQLSDVTQRVAELKREQKELTKEIEAGNDADGEKAKQLVEVSTQLKQMTAQQKALTGQLQTTLNANSQLGDSYREMDANLRMLEDQYKSLTKAQRESAEGEKLKAAINQQKDALKEFDAGIGNYQRNVGNYTNSILDAFNKMPGSVQKVVNPIKNVTMGFKTLSATPAIAILGFIVQILQKLISTLKGSEDGLGRASSAMGVFAGVGVIVQKLLERLSEGLSKVIDWLVGVADKLGLVSEEMKESQRLQQEQIALSERQRALTMEEADAALEVAKLRAQAAQKDKLSSEERLSLLQQAADKEREIAKQRQEVAQREYELIKRQNAQTKSTKEELDREAQAYARMVQTQTDYFRKTIELESQMVEARRSIDKQNEESAKKAAERRKAIADETKKVMQEWTEAYLYYIEDERERELASLQLQYSKEIEALRTKLETDKNLTVTTRQQINDIIEQKEDELQDKLSAKRAEYAEEDKKAAEKQAIDILKLQRQVEDSRLSIMTEGEERELAQTRAKYEREIATLQERYNQEAALSAEHEAYLSELILNKRTELAQSLAAIEKRYQDERVESEKTANEELEQARLSMVASLGSAFGAMSDLLDNWAEESEEAAAAAKGFALAQIIADNARAIAAGVSAAAQGVAQSQVLPFPANLAAMATTVASITGIIASVLSGISQAKQVLSESKFATGGIVGGTSWSGDRVPAMVNSGEMVLNKQQQTRLFEIANTQTSQSTESLQAAISAALRDMPAPTLVYKEFEDFQSNIVNIRELQRL